MKRVLMVVMLGLSACDLSVSGTPGEDALPAEALSELRACLGPSRLSGIDVSVYQGRVDWPTVKAAGNAFAYTRIGDGTTRDTRFAENWAGMQNAGLIRGAYHFFRVNVDPDVQASNAVSAVGRLGPGDLPVMADLEDLSTPRYTKAQIAQRLQRYLDLIEQGTGKRPTIYTAQWWWDPHVGSAAFGRYPLVVAYYGSGCPPMPLGWSTMAFWQYRGDQGRMAGVAGPVDLDFFNGDLDALKTLAGLSTAAVPAGGIAGSFTALGAPQYFTPIAPTRVLDSRDSTKVTGGSTRALDLTGVAPAGTTAVSLQLTAVNAVGNGYLALLAPGRGVETSSLNFGAATPISSGAVAPVQAGFGTVFASTTTDVVADVTGTFSPSGSGFVAAQARLFDSRESGRLQPGEVRMVTVNAPAGATAAALGVVAVGPSQAGFVTVFPCASPSGAPGTSTVNFVAGDVIASATSVGLGPNVCVSSKVAVDVVLDLQGWFLAGGGAPFIAAAPTRLLDTRSGAGEWKGTLAAGQEVSLSLAALPGLPAGTQAVTLNVTAVNPQAAGYLTVSPCGQRGTTSNGNLRPGRISATLVQVAPSAGGQVCVFSTVATDLVVDLFGAFAR
ncbi:MAG: hypothetical protein K1X89_08145 [Myxococcaceae bacterium]|nr:hypothetical protein [Myxococcaceae bacterium]